MWLRACLHQYNRGIRGARDTIDRPLSTHSWYIDRRRTELLRHAALTVVLASVTDRQIDVSNVTRHRAHNCKHVTHTRLSARLSTIRNDNHTEMASKFHITDFA